MDPSPRPSFRLLRALFARLRGRWVVQSGLLAAGIAGIAVTAVALLAVDWGGGTERGIAAPGAEPSGLGLAGALASIDADRLGVGLEELEEALRPTATLTPTPTPTPTPVPPTATPPPPPPPAPPPLPPASLPEPVVPEPVAPAPSSCPTASMSGFARALFDANNSERVQRGLPALQPHGCVTYVSQLRSNDMAARGYFSHTSPEGETAFSLLDKNGVPHGWAGENLARNNFPNGETVQVAIRDLMASDGHRANILSTNYTHLGVGFAVDGSGMKYFTMIYIGPP